MNWKLNISRLIHSVMPENLLIFDIDRKVEKIKNNSNIFVAPDNNALPRILRDGKHMVAFIPYCTKPFDCPMNRNGSRKNRDCLLLNGEKCQKNCSIKHFVYLIRRFGISNNDIFIIDSDDNLFDWLVRKSNQGNRFFIGAGCPYGVSYSLDYIIRDIGMQGIGIKLGGDVCSSMTDYYNMEHSDKGKHTYIPVRVFGVLRELVTSEE